MSWQTTKAAILAAVRTAAGIPPQARAVAWNTRPTPFGSKAVTLTTTAAKAWGPNRLVQVWNNTNHNFDVASSSLHNFTVSIRCEDMTGDAQDLCETIRAGLGLQAPMAALNAAGVVLVSTESSTTPVIGVNGDQREVSAYTFDVFFRHELYRADPDPIEVIEAVEITPTIEGTPKPPFTIEEP